MDDSCGRILSQLITSSLCLKSITVAALWNVDCRGGNCGNKMTARRLLQ